MRTLAIGGPSTFRKPPRNGSAELNFPTFGKKRENAERAGGVPAFQKARDELAIRLRQRDAPTWRAMLDDLQEVERRTRRGTLVDANDLTVLALRWRRAGNAAASPRSSVTASRRT